jgi:predicted phage terminase large subunit-like protein
VDQLRDITELNVTKTPAPATDKGTRLNAASPIVEAGRVYLVEGQWNEDVMDEISGFPAKTHDEFVDLLCYAIDYHIRPTFKKEPDYKQLENMLY